MISKELRDDAKTAAQIYFCNGLSVDKLEDWLGTVKPIVGKEMREVINVILKEVRLVEKRINDYYNECEAAMMEAYGVKE